MDFIPNQKSIEMDERVGTLQMKEMEVPFCSLVQAGPILESRHQKENPACIELKLECDKVQMRKTKRQEQQEGREGRLKGGREEMKANGGKD